MTVFWFYRSKIGYGAFRDLARAVFGSKTVVRFKQFTFTPNFGNIISRVRESKDKGPYCIVIERLEEDLKQDLALITHCLEKYQVCVYFTDDKGRILGFKEARLDGKTIRFDPVELFEYYERTLDKIKRRT